MATTFASRHILGRVSLIATFVKNREIQNLFLGPSFFMNSRRIRSMPAAFAFLTLFKALCTYFSIKSSIKVDLSSHLSSTFFYSLAIVMFFCLVGLIFEVLKRLLATAFGVMLFYFLVCWVEPSFLKRSQLFRLE